MPRTRPGQEPEHGNSLPDVQERQHHLFGAPVVRGDRAVDEREREREQVRREPRESERSVYRGSAEGERSISTVGRIGASQRWASPTTPATSAPSTTRSTVHRKTRETPRGAPGRTDQGRGLRGRMRLAPAPVSTTGRSGDG